MQLTTRSFAPSFFFFNIQVLGACSIPCKKSNKSIDTETLIFHHFTEPWLKTRKPQPYQSKYDTLSKIFDII